MDQPARRPQTPPSVEPIRRVLCSATEVSYAVGLLQWVGENLSSQYEFLAMAGLMHFVLIFKRPVATEAVRHWRDLGDPHARLHGPNPHCNVYVID